MLRSTEHDIRASWIQGERTKRLNDLMVRDGRYVLYWMQAAQRSEYNHALEYAIEKANDLNRPLVVFFGITERFPEANERHYWFMLEGLLEVKNSLEERGIQIVIWHKSPEVGALEMSENASLLIVDRGYLKIQKKWYDYVAQRANCPLIQVETDVVVPVETASSKEEYSAATLRPKLTRVLSNFLHPLKKKNLKLQSLNLEFESVEMRKLEYLMEKLNIDRTVTRVRNFRGGTQEAKKWLEVFIRHKLDHYPALKNDPAKDFLSNMSPYLHFGQISPLYIASKVMRTDSPGKEAYLEELIVRRELSMNFVFYNKKYDSFDCLPKWTKDTLIAHQKDLRHYQYGLDELEKGQTHDPVWNAAQKEMVINGKMHGYMRMYWGKKIIEWTKNPREAFKIALYLNRRYELDGRNPNGFAGVAWCFGKHDRPWKERQIFGKVRYMSDSGLKRKFDVGRYIQKAESLNSS